MSKQEVQYKVRIQGEVEDLLKKLGTVKKEMSNLSVGDGATATRSINQIEKSLNKLMDRTAAPITSKAMFENLSKEAALINQDILRIMETIVEFSDLAEDQKLSFLPEDEQKKIVSAEKALKNYLDTKDETVKKSKEHIEAENKLQTLQKKVKEQKTTISAKEGILKSAAKELELYRQQADALNDKKEALFDYLKAQTKLSTAKTDKGRASAEADLSMAKERAVSLGIDVDNASIAELNQLLQTFTNQTKDAGKAVTDASNRHRDANNELVKLKDNLKLTEAQYDATSDEVDQFNQSFANSNAAKRAKDYQDLIGVLKNLGVAVDGIPLDASEEGFKQLQNAVRAFKQEGLDAAQASVDQIRVSLTEMGITTSQVTDKLNNGKEAFTKLDEKASQTEAFTERIKQFVGLQGAALVARHAVQNAMATIKELDATMTEMAVVTDLTVGDYWSQLPQYSKQASDLGVSINSAYKAATLYYQQGLKGNEVTKISAQTLKMARIAGLNAEDATNKMTAALRGFNMELNEMSAQRVADVYSELAAITAADTKEISTAMTKTASIANSANMEFETTAAFLSQIIETTRESAETAGTAMKTIIARFQELKKDPAEIGEVDGEIVDANKIETALRSVGVALRDSSGQFRDLDDVFLELSSKWGTLDTNTQRYIATIAAGSRQQSRFIAMMSDYNRTQDLVTAANNSAGASNEQFQKTMDSLQSKLEKLKNAWDTFTMGIMDSDILKVGVDILTTILETINKITEAFGPLSGAAKIGVLVAGLYAGDNALKVFQNTLKEVNDEGQRVNGVFDAFRAIGTAAVDSVKDKFNGLKSSISSIKTMIQDLSKHKMGDFASGKEKMFGEGGVFNRSAKKSGVTTESKEEIITRTNDTMKKSDKKANSSSAKLVAAEKKLAKASQDRTKAIEKQKAAIKSKEAIQKSSVGNEENRLKRIALLDKQAENNKQIELKSTKDITAAKAQITKQTNQLEAAQKASQAALLEQAAARGLDNAQQQTALGLQSLDIAQDATILQNLGMETAGEAAQAATLGGLTMAKMADYEASMIAAGLDEEEIARRKGMIFQLFAQTGAQGLQTTAESAENATQVTGIALLWSKITAGAANIANLISQTIAQWNLNAAVYAGCPPMILLAAVILIVVAAIALAVLAIVGLVAMFKKVQENTIDGQIAKTKERLQEFTEASEAAKDSLDEMYAAQDEYNNLQDSFKDLVEGTQEWNKALLEANANVLSLIQKYPELAGYMENIDGRLTINEEGWEKLQEKQMQVVENTQLAVQRENVNLLQLQGQKKTEELYNKTGQIQASKVSGAAAAINPMGLLPGGAVIGAASAAIQSSLSEATEEWGVLGDVLTFAATSLVNPVGAFTGLIAEKFVEPVEKESKEKTGELARRALEEGISLDESDKAEFAELYKEIFDTEMTDEFYNNLQENADEFFELGAQLNAAQAALEAYSDSLITAATDDTVENSEWGGTVQKALQNSISGEETQEDLEQKKKDIKKETSKKEALQMYAEQMGYTYHKGKVYKTDDINEVGDDTKMDVDMDIVYEQLAQAAVKNDYAAQAEKAVKVLESGKFENEKDKQQTMRIMGGDAKDLTTSDLKAIQDAGGIKEYLKARNIDSEELGINLDSLSAETIEKTQKQNEKTKTEIAASLKLEDTSQLDAAFEGLTAKQMKSMQTQYENLVDFYGPELGQKMLDLQSTMMSEESPLSQDTQELLNQQMSTIDWSDASQIDGLTEQIAAMGDITEEERIALEGFEDAMIATAKATKKIDVGALKEMAKNLKDITGSIKGGDRNVSKEQMEALKGAGVDVSEFVETAEGFRYLGTTADFVKEVSKAASKQLEETRQNFENIRENARQSMDNYLAAKRNLENYTASQEEAEKEKLTGWEALAQWFKDLWEKIKAIFGAIWDGIKWAYNTYIKPVIEAIKNIVMQFWDMIVTVVNGVIKFFGDIWNWIGEKLCQGINAVIDLINKLPGVNIKKISFNKVDTTGLKNSEQLKEDKEKAEREAEVEKRKEEMLTALGELTQGLTDYTSSIYSLADSVDVGVLLAYQEQDKKSAEESIAKMEQEIINDYGSVTNAPKEIQEAYEALVKAKDEVDKTYDKALVSKAMGLEGLEAEAHEFNKALKDGNTEVAEDLKRKLANAISKKTAEDALSTMVESMQPIVEKILELGAGTEDAARSMRRLAYYMGFEDLDTGVEFLTENFEILQYALEGDLRAWQQLQIAMAKGLGVNIDNISNIGTGFDNYVRGNSLQSGNDVLDSLIGSGMYHVVEKVATETMSVADIVYSDGEANLGQNGTKTVNAGDTYYTIEALDADSLSSFIDVERYLSSYTQLELLNRDLEKIGREREKAEEAYIAALESETATMEDLISARQEVFDSIEAEMRENDRIRQVAAANLQRAYTDAVSKNSKFADFVSINADNEVVVDKSYAYSNELTDSEKKVFDEIIGTLFDFEDQITDANESFEEGNKLLNDIKKEARSQTLDVFERTKEALIKERQDVIDSLSEINDSISEANEKLLSSIQAQIDSEREQRDNQKTEKELSDSYSKLAYLQSDSSGANILEQLELEKSIEEQEEAYQDTLVDQAIARLEDANELAAEQRERQIALLEQQLESYENSQVIWADVGNLVWGAAESYMAGTPLDQTAWYNLISESENWDTMNPYERDEVKNETEEAFMGVLTTGGLIEPDGDTTATDVYTYFDGGPLPVEGQLTTTTTTTRETVYSNNTPAIKAAKEYDDFVSNPSNVTAVAEGLNNRAMRDLHMAKGDTILMVNLGENGEKIYAEPIGVNVTVTTYNEKGEVVDAKTSFESLDRNEKGSLTHYTGPMWIDGTRTRPEMVLNANQTQDMISTIDSLDRGVWPGLPEELPALERLRKSVPKLPQYKTGGIADFTGPAWLDGTKTKPEIILNQQDSQNFLTLKDILSDLLNGHSLKKQSNENKSGDNYYDIDINVESLDDDYSVEEIAEKIKKIIHEEATMRGVQSLSLAR